MPKFIESAIAKEIINFHCPRYEEFPDVDLYMEQVVEFLNRHLSVFLSPNEEKSITPTMVNNYVKQKVITPPNKKRYARIQLVHLFVIGILKQVLNIADVAKLIELQIRMYPIDMAYNYFCAELEQALHATFITRDFSAQSPIIKNTTVSEIVRSALWSFANKIYVKKYLLYRTRMVKSKTAFNYKNDK